MAFASVTREQFEIRSEVGAVHIPTGADFRAYPETAIPMTCCKASHLSDGQRFPFTPLDIASVEPVEAAVGIIRPLLLGK